MGEKRKYKTGIKINEGADLYDLHKEKWVKTATDILVTDWQEHVGHVRFGYKDSRYSLKTSYNRNQFEFLYG